MPRRWHHGSPSNAAHPALASDDAAQPSSLAGSAEQPADESYRRAWDGELYTRAEFRNYYGPDLGEAHWQNAQDELTQWDGPTDVRAIGALRLRSAEQPASSLHRAAQLASREVHNAAHAKHTEYMMFLQSILNDFYDIWRCVNAPKKVRASWSSEWNNLARTLEALARDAAAHNCLHELDCSVSRVVQPASVEKLSATSSLLFRKVSTTCEREAELLLLLDRLSLVTVHKITWEEVKRFFESTRGDDAAFNTHCAAEAARELNEGNLHMKNVAAAAQQLLDVPSWTAR